MHHHLEDSAHRIARAQRPIHLGLHALLVFRIDAVQQHLVFSLRATISSQLAARPSSALPTRTTWLATSTPNSAATSSPMRRTPPRRRLPRARPLQHVARIGNCTSGSPQGRHDPASATPPPYASPDRPPPPAASPPSSSSRHWRSSSPPATRWSCHAAPRSECAR